ncbi:MORN-repeat protein [Pacmanvirus S19]|nr:MORN-repeat protein [Pacmanvirus S19]
MSIVRLSDEVLDKIRQMKDRNLALFAKQHSENAERMFATFTIKEQIELLDEYYIFGNTPTMVDGRLKIQRCKKQHMYCLDGKLHGECIYWHSNGKLHRRVNFADDKLNGEFHAWYSNGVKAIECYYLDDKLHGKYRSWDCSGEIKDIICFENGEIIATEDLRFSKATIGFYGDIRQIESEIHQVNSVGVRFNIDMLFSGRYSK